MREIKFRAWSIDNEVMYQPGDEYGTTTDLDCVRYFSEGQNVILLQFTGLTDSEGTDLYDGDVVVDNNGRGFIEYVDDCAAFRVNYFGNTHAKWFYDYLTRELKTLLKIGNIHQQPELLEQSS